MSTEVSNTIYAKLVSAHALQRGFPPPAPHPQLRATADDATADATSDSDASPKTSVYF